MFLSRSLMFKIKDGMYGLQSGMSQKLCGTIVLLLRGILDRSEGNDGKVVFVELEEGTTVIRVDPQARLVGRLHIICLATT